MITLALFNQMADEHVGGLTKNVNFYWEEIPLQSNGNPASGVWLVTRGGSVSDSPRGLNLRTTVDFYVALPDKMATERMQQTILEWLIANPCFCDLYSTDYSYTNVRIRPTQTPNNAGVTQNGIIVKVASAQITYDLNK